MEAAKAKASSSVRTPWHAEQALNFSVKLALSFLYYMRMDVIFGFLGRKVIALSLLLLNLLGQLLQ